MGGGPVLVSDRGALPERVRNGGGLSTSLAEFASNLLALLVDRPRRMQLAADVNTSRVSDPGLAAARHLAIYQEVLGQR